VTRLLAVEVMTVCSRPRHDSRGDESGSTEQNLSASTEVE